MKILVYRWRAYPYRDLIDAMTAAGHEAESFLYDIADYDCDPKFSALMQEMLADGNYDIVFSFNYFTVISNVCEKNKIPYVCWNCDSMLISMYNRSVFHEYNYIFTFDMADVKKFRSMGVKHIFYLPLAVSLDRIGKTLEQGENRFCGEISFVGNLYERNRYDAVESHLTEYQRGYLEASLWAQLKVSGGNLLTEMLTEEFLLGISDQFELKKQEESFADLNLIFSSTVLGFKAANMERELSLNALSLSHEVNLYTTGNTKSLPLVKNRGKADYWEEMPHIFKNSKINLNFTIPNIIDGTPLRVWDILACGGFCMTSYREDLLRHFENGKDLVIFEGKEDLLQKADYYLSHDAEREAIAANGFRKMKQHTYKIRLEEMFRILEELLD